MAGINVQFHPEKFEDAIDRHGQLLWWYSALPCHCLDDMGRVDPACRKCLGKGYIYYPTKYRRRIEYGMSLGSTEITTKYTIKEVHKVYRKDGTNIPVSNYLGKIITLASSLNRGQYVVIDYTEDLSGSYVGSATYEGGGIVKANITAVTNEQGIFYGQIIEVTYLKNVTKNITIPVLAFWENLILTSGSIDEGDVLEVSCVYIKPIKFLVNSITQKEMESNPAAWQDADASCTYPGYLTIGKGDIITLLKAQQRDSIVGNYIGGESHEIPYFHLSSIIRIEDSIGEIANVSIIKNNEILFSGRKPEGKFSLSFMYNPSFVVLRQSPSLRYGENKVFPKKVVLKRHEMMSRADRRPIQQSGYEMEDVY